MSQAYGIEEAQIRLHGCTFKSPLSTDSISLDGPIYIYSKCINVTKAYIFLALTGTGQSNNKIKLVQAFLGTVTKQVMENMNNCVMSVLEHFIECMQHFLLSDMFTKATL